MTNGDEHEPEEVIDFHIAWPKELVMQMAGKANELGMNLDQLLKVAMFTGVVRIMEDDDPDQAASLRAIYAEMMGMDPLEAAIKEANE